MIESSDTILCHFVSMKILSVPSILRNSRYRRDQRQLDEEEEMWFNEEEDFDEGEAVVPAAAADIVSPTSAKKQPNSPNSGGSGGGILDSVKDAGSPPHQQQHSPPQQQTILNNNTTNSTLAVMSVVTPSATPSPGRELASMVAHHQQSQINSGGSPTSTNDSPLIGVTADAMSPTATISAAEKTTSNIFKKVCFHV